MKADEDIIGQDIVIIGTDGSHEVSIIPRKILISKRLAQCMHPVLPSGVHQKALETYNINFKCMGTKMLASELLIRSVPY